MRISDWSSDVCSSDLIMVTHDQEEALMLADKIVCMNEGRIEQVGTPQDLYLRPETRFVADFVGVSNLLETAWIRKNAPALLAGRPAGPDADCAICEHGRAACRERGCEYVYNSGG